MYTVAEEKNPNDNEPRDWEGEDGGESEHHKETGTRISRQKKKQDRSN